MGGGSRQQKRRRNEGDNMKGKIRRWEETPLRKYGVGSEGRGEEKIAGALHSDERMGGREGGRGGMGEEMAYLSSGYFGNMDSVLQTSFKVELALARSGPENTSHRLQ